MKKLILIAALMSSAAMADPTNFPTLHGSPVEDAAHALSADQVSSLDKQIRDVNAKSGHQLALVTTPSLQDYAVEDYGYQLGRKLGLGSKAKNDGVLLLWAPVERKVRIEVGYGLEGTLTDARSSEIMEGSIIPRMKQKDYYGAMTAGVKRIGDVISVPESAVSSAAPEKKTSPSFAFFGVFLGLFGAAGLGLWIIRATNRSRREEEEERLRYREDWRRFRASTYPVGTSKSISPMYVAPVVVPESETSSDDSYSSSSSSDSSSSSWSSGSSSSDSSSSSGFDGGGGTFGGGGDSGSY